MYIPVCQSKSNCLGPLLVLCLWSLRRFKGFGARHSRKRPVGAGVIFLQTKVQNWFRKGHLGNLSWVVLHGLGIEIIAIIIMGV